MAPENDVDVATEVLALFLRSVLQGRREDADSYARSLWVEIEAGGQVDVEKKLQLLKEAEGER